MDFPANDMSNGLSIRRATCFSGKTCENLRGLRIHQTKMGCIRRKQVEQHTEAVLSTVAGETEEEQDPESPHSVQTLQALHAAPSKPSEHRRVLWPAANKGPERHQFDEDVDAALEAASWGTVDQQLQSMCTLIISIGGERFGINNQRPRTSPG